MILSLMLAAASPEPLHETGLVIVSDQSMIDLHSCIARTWAKMGTVTALPLPDGTALDFQVKSAFISQPGQPLFSLEIRERDQHRQLTILYHHPMSARGSYNWFKDTAKRCFLPEWEAAALKKPGS